ncbi:MAG: class I SAM-dependent methyltransferase [Spirochaetota bacterium]
MTRRFRTDKRYKEFLVTSPESLYMKYCTDVLRYLSPRGKFLDVGCGTGTALRMLSRTRTRRDLFGIDVSGFFLKECRVKANVRRYSGSRIPYPDGYFSVVGSFTVFEHVADPYGFLREQIRVLEPGGVCIVATPNFLGIFNSVRGYSLREKFMRVLRYALGVPLEMNEPIERPQFMPDDDAVVVANSIPIVRYFRAQGLRILHNSGAMQPLPFPASILARMPLLRLLLPSCYIIARKEKQRSWRCA